MIDDHVMIVQKGLLSFFAPYPLTIITVLYMRR